MKRLRIPLLTVCLLFLAALATGWYFHQNLATLLRQQIVPYLAPYGVEDIDYEGLQVSLRAVHIDTLRVRGRYDNVSYRVSAHNTVLQYQWLALLRGRAESLHVESLELIASSDTTGAARDTNGMPLTLPLPQDLVARLPWDSLQVENWRIDYTGVDLPALHATGRLLLAQQIDLQFESTFADTLISASVTAGDSPATLTLSVSLRDQSQQIATVLAQLQSVENARWQWHLQGDWDSAAVLAGWRQLNAQTRLLPAFTALDELALQGKGSLALQIEHPSTLHTDASYLAPWMQQLEISGRLEQALQQLGYADNATGVQGSIVVGAELHERKLAVTLEPTEITGELATRLLQMPTEAQHWLQWGETTPFRWSNAQSVSAVSDDLIHWHLNLDTPRITIGTSASQLLVDTVSLQINLDVDTPKQFDARLFTTLYTTLRKKPLPPLELRSALRGEVGQIGVQLQLSDIPKNLALDLQGNIDPVTGAGRYTLQANSERLPQLAATVDPLLHHFKLLTPHITLTGGTFSWSSTLTAANADLSTWRQQSQLQLDSVSGALDEIQFDSLSAHAQWQGIDTWQTLQPLSIALKSIQPGVAIHNLQATISLPEATPPGQPRMQLEAFSANLFGGDITLVEPVIWDAGATSNSLLLRTGGWQLAELVALQQNTDIQAEGVLEGELPLSLVGGRAVINNGFLRALPPGGTIRYSANDASRALAADSAEMALALDLLSDFHYNALGSTVQLDKDGTLLLGLSLAGSNPSLYEGQAVNFNINLEQNIDPLLQSLQLSDKLIRRIEGGLQ